MKNSEDSLTDILEASKGCGFVYVMNNDYLDGVVKIGYTNRSPETRAKELSSTGVPGKFVVQFFAIVKEAEKLEGEIHRELEKYNASKEFFEISVLEAVKSIKNLIVNNEYHCSYFGGPSANLFLLPSEEKVREESNKKSELASLIKKQSAAEAHTALAKVVSVGRKYNTKFSAIENSIPWYKKTILEVPWEIYFNIGKTFATTASEEEKTELLMVYESLNILSREETYDSIDYGHVITELRKHCGGGWLFEEVLSRPNVSSTLAGVIKAIKDSE